MPTLSSSSSGGTTQPAAEKPKGPATLAYVRLDDLKARHPLRGDVERLNNARNRLISLLPVAGATAGGIDDPYTLSALTSSESASALHRAHSAIEANRQMVRARLLARAADQLAAFLKGTAYLQEQLLARRRAELEAAGQADQERAAKDIRNQEAEGVRARVSAKTPEMVDVQAKATVVGAQLQPSQQLFLPPATDREPNPQPVVIMPPALDQKTLDEEIQKLQADPNVGGVSMRARFTLSRQQILERLRALRKEINALIAEGDKSANERIIALRDARLAEIEAELESLRDDSEGQFLVRSQRAALQNILTAEEALAKRSASELNAVGASGTHTVAGEAQFASLFNRIGANQSVRGALDVRQALSRVEDQKERLEQFIAVDVKDAVKDAAEKHHVDVAFAPEPRRKDMTAQFAQWTGFASAPQSAMPTEKNRGGASVAAGG